MSTATAAPAQGLTPTSSAEIAARKTAPASTAQQEQAASTMSVEDRITELERVVAILRFAHFKTTGTVISTIGYRPPQAKKPAAKQG